MTLKTASISIVIPTYKRTESLERLLKSIEKQSILPEEIFIVSAGIKKNILTELVSKFNLPLVVLFSEPSVCKQRNLGIKKSTGKYIQLIDDDIELPTNYLKELYKYHQQNNNVWIVSGEETLLDSKKNWKVLQQNISTLNLGFNYIFGLPIWSNLAAKKPKNSISKYLINAYLKKGNTLSKAGWPVVCNFSKTISKTTIYSLQGAMIKSIKLKQNLFDENLQQHGLGDNYDVTLKINELKNKIHILKRVPYKHYKEKSNRLEFSKQYYERTKALSYFLKKLPFFTFKNQLFFIWSLIGNGLFFLFKGKIKYFYENIRVGIYTIKTIIN
jgi:glycosyltransferase involved in cell wall biosynthesis